MADNLALVLQLLLDEQAKNKTVKGLKEIKTAADAVNGGENQNGYTARGETPWTEEEKAAAKLARDTRSAAIAQEIELKKVEGERFKKSAEGIKQNAELQAKYTAREEAVHQKLVDDMNARSGGSAAFDMRSKEKADAEEILRLAQAKKDMDKQSLEIQKGIREEYGNQMHEVRVLTRQASMLQQASMAMTIGGGAIVGGIYASANKEAQRQQSAKTMTAETERWFAAQQRIELSTERLGRVAITSILPYLEKASALAERASQYIEAHPELASAALTTGATLLTLGAITGLAAKGIKMYADLKYQALQIALSVATEANTVALEASTAVLLSKNAYGVAGGLIGPAEKGLAGAGAGAAGIGIGSVAGFAAVAVAVLALQVGIAKLAELLKPKVAEITGLSKKATNVAMDSILILLTTGMYPLGKAVLGLIDPASKAATAVKGLGSNLANEKTAMDMMTKLQEENNVAERKYADDRAGIIADTAKALDKSNKDLDKNLTEIASNLDKNIVKNNEAWYKAAAKLEADYNESDAKANAAQQKKQADIAKTGADNILKIHADNQKALEQLDKDHAQRLSDLGNARDALGIFKENQAYADKKDELNKGVEEAVKQARAETQAKLVESAQAFKEESAQRKDDYNKRQAELKQEAIDKSNEDIANAKEAKDKAIAAQAEEAANIAAQQAEKLNDLQKNFNEERNARAVATYNQIKDLGGALNAERSMRLQYQAAILADSTAHMAALRQVQAGLTGGSTNLGATATVNGVKTPTKIGATATAIAGRTAAGGYADRPGLWMRGEAGREFTADNPTTKALESLVGGRLTQQNILNAGRGKSVTWVDQRHFEADVSVATREAINRDTIEIINNALGA